MAKNENIKVIITSVAEKDGCVTVKGRADGLGERRVEIIVNGDLNRRYVADNDGEGNWICEFSLHYNGEYTVEASVRDYSDFSKLIQRTPDENYLVVDKAFVWGAGVVKHTDGLYYMIFSTWDEKKLFKTWCRSSELGYAVSTKLFGPYVYQGKTLDGTYSNTVDGKPVVWEDWTLNVFHNAKFMRSKKDGRYYIHFIATSNEVWDDAGKRQRIGYAVSDSPTGPWEISKSPVITARPGYHDAVWVSNPTVVEYKDEADEYKYLAVYRANNPPVKVSGYATANSLTEPFKQAEKPIMVNKEHAFAVEDCDLWRHNGQFYCLAKDMSKGDFSGYRDGYYSYALFESVDGENWPLSKNNGAFPNIIPWESGDERVGRLERAGVYLENEVPFMLTCAMRENEKIPESDELISEHTQTNTANIQIPLLGVPMATDSYTLVIEDCEDKKLDLSELKKLLAKAHAANEEDYSTEDWRILLSAARAGEILLGRESAEQLDIDFVAKQLR